MNEVIGLGGHGKRTHRQPQPLKLYRAKEMSDGTGLVRTR